MPLYLNMANTPVKILGNRPFNFFILLSICPMHFEVQWHPSPYICMYKMRSTPPPPKSVPPPKMTVKSQHW